MLASFVSWENPLRCIPRYVFAAAAAPEAEADPCRGSGQDADASERGRMTKAPESLDIHESLPRTPGPRRIVKVRRRRRPVAFHVAGVVRGQDRKRRKGAREGREEGLSNQGTNRGRPRRRAPGKA
jgi:hypothetical protein